MADGRVENDERGAERPPPPRVPGFFSSLYQAGMADPHAARHVHPASPVETELFGFRFEAVAGDSDGFVVSRRIQGFSAILEIRASSTASASGTNMHGVGIALGRSVPVDAAGFNGLAQVLPFANSVSTSRNLLEWDSSATVVEVRGRFAFKAMNRGLVVRFANRSSVTASCWVGLVIEKVH